MRRLPIVFSLAPGVVDAGLGSLAGFSASVYAVRFFEVSQLGLFSLFFVAFMLLGPVSARLALLPSQVATLDTTARQRTAILARSLPLGAAVGLAAIPLVWLVVLLAPPSNREDLIAFGLTTSAMVLVSPLQDHMRTILHMADRPIAAVAVSVTQLAITLAVIVGLHVSGVPARWVPFTALAIANSGSLALGAAIARPPFRSGLSWWPGTGEILRSGRLLLPAQLLVAAGSFGAAVLVARLASTEVLGAAEAARVIASPILVAGAGLGMALNPRIMESARAGRVHEFVGALRLFAAAMLVLALGWLAVAGWDHPLNLVERAVPLAYSEPGLAAVRILSASALVMGRLPGMGLLGRGDNRALLGIAAGAAGAQLVVAAVVAPTAGAYTIPLAEFGEAVVVLFLTIPRLRGMSVALARRVAASP